MSGCWLVRPRRVKHESNLSGCFALPSPPFFIRIPSLSSPEQAWLHTGRMGDVGPAGDHLRGEESAFVVGSVGHSVTQSVSQLVSQLASQPIDRRIDRCTDPRLNQRGGLLGQSITNDGAADQSIDRSIHPSITQSIGWGFAFFRVVTLARKTGAFSFSPWRTPT